MYSTPMYNYQKATNDLTTQKGLQDIAQNYGRFLSQERHRRGLQDGMRQFKDQFPTIGRNFNRRNMYHSGMRKEAQQRGAQDFQRQTDRFNYDFSAGQQNDQQVQAFRDAQYQQAMNALYEEFQRQRAAGFDPFAGVVI